MMNKLKETSRTAISKSVLSQAAQQPISVYPLAMGALGGFSALLFSPNFISLGLMTTGVVLGLGGFAAKYVFNKESYANNYMQAVRKKLIERRRHIMDGLSESLNQANELEGIKQISLFKDKYENLLSILDKKLNPGELTHTRYLTIAEQVFLGGLDNLQSVALALKSVSAIDIQHIERMISEAEVDAKTQINEAMLARKQLYEKQQARADNLLAQNEMALTHLDQVTTKLANIKTEQGHAVMDIEDAMDELKTLIQRADSYSINK